MGIGSIYLSGMIKGDIKYNICIQREENLWHKQLERKREREALTERIRSRHPSEPSHIGTRNRFPLEMEPG